MKIQSHIDAELSQLQMKDLARLLVGKRKDLEERVVNLEKQMTIKDDCSLTDAADAASLQENRLRARGMVEQHQQVMREIDAALRRFKNGTFGISEATGEPIAFDRLALTPWARNGAND